MKHIDLCSKTGALALGITLALTTPAFAAPEESATDLDSRIAAIEAQQKALEEELAALKHENSQLKNQVKSTKAQAKNTSTSLNEFKNRLQINGFGRLSWDNDNLKGYNDRNDGSRTYLDLKAKFKINDKWNFNFESETNDRYKKYDVSDGTKKYHFGRDDEDGTIQRVWAEGKIGAVDVDAGRRWRGLGFQNVLFGNESDGVVLSTPIPKSKLKASAFYLTPTDKGFHFSVYGAGVQGFIGHGLQINCAFAKANVGKRDSLGQDYYAPVITLGTNGGTFTGTGNMTMNGWSELHGWIDTASEDAGWTQKIGIPGNDNDQVQAGKVPQSYIGKPQVDGNYKFDGKSTLYPALPNDIGSQGFVLSAMWNPLKNIFLIGDYVRTNASDYVDSQWGGWDTSKDHKHKADTAIRLNYRWSNINNPGSFQLYARWFNYGENVNHLVGLFGDKEWGAFQPGSKGWAFGFKYVPLKNVEWETFYLDAKAHDTKWGAWDNVYSRHFLRTMVDYHF